MRASPTDVTGNVGETEVTAKFERLGWGVAPNSRHDLGTDLWLQARDARLFDLGLVIGAQVKGGPTWFKEEVQDESGAVRGWWFRDYDRQHIDAWLAYNVPYILVLHDLTSQTSYWVHVREDAVISTGQGAKILVPIESTLDEAHREDLLRVAASKRTSGTWEGSAWGGANLPQSALLRHALIAPRLIAPHPNIAGHDPVTSAQAIALLVQGRHADLTGRPAHQGSASLEEALASGDWDWRLVGAMRRRVLADEYLPLVALVDAAPDAARRSAVTVAAAAAMIERGLADDALAILDVALAEDDAEPVDHAWLTVQKVRACVEVGFREEARSLAARVQAMSVTHGGDVTATAMAGAAAAVMFGTSDLEEQDVAAVVTSVDTAAAWWRAQTTARALTASAERAFRAWSRDTTLRIGASDVAHDQLLSAALTASHVGDHEIWRHLTSLLARDGLVRTNRHTDSEIISFALDRLRLSGDTHETKKAVGHLVSDGPIAAVTMIAARVDLDASTRTTAPADLALLEVGGDVLDSETADRTVQWLLSTLDDATGFITRTTPSYLIGHRLIDTLAGVVPAAPEETRRLVAHRVAALAPQTDQGHATAWARVFDALPEGAWTREADHLAMKTAGGHHAVLGIRMLERASRHSEDARQQLLEAAGNGSLDALSALGDVRALPDNLIQALIEKLALQVIEQIEVARQGTFRSYSNHGAETLALLNVWHPKLADWDPLVTLIADPLVAGQHKRGAMHQLTALAHRVPDHVRERLLAAAEAAATQPLHSLARLWGRSVDARGSGAELAIALGPIDSVPDPEGLLTLLSGDENNRASAARISGRLRRDEDVGVLLVLAQDPEATVRSVAASNLAAMAAGRQGGQSALAGARRAAADPGKRVALALAGVLSGHADLPLEMEQVLITLRGHPSAAVRTVASESSESALPG